MLPPTPAILLIDDLPAHPLVVHLVVVLLPLAALGGLLMALLPSMRRRFGVAVLLLAAAGVATVPIATNTGEELKSALPPNNPLIDAHQQRGDELLPYALAFGIAVVFLVIAGKLADRERGTNSQAAQSAAHAAQSGAHGAQSGAHAAQSGANAADPPEGGEAAEPASTRRTWRRLALVAAALVAFSAVAVTVQVVRVGHSGSVAVWDGVGRD